MTPKTGDKAPNATPRIDSGGTRQPVSRITEMLRTMFVGLALLLSSSAATVAFAASPPVTPLPGTIAGAGHAGQTNGSFYVCTVSLFVEALNSSSNAEVPISSTFSRTGTGPATISFPADTVWFNIGPPSGPPTTYDVYGGLAVLNFTSGTSGNLVFDFPPVSLITTEPDPKYQSIPFSAYRQTYNATSKVLNVSFTIKFLHCPVSVTAIYRG